MAALAAASLVATGLCAVLTPGNAWAHGTLTTPASRTYACYVEGTNGSGGGQIIPKTPACADAVAQGGTQPLYDWYAVLRSDGAGRVQGFIPDGQLCSAGTTKYAPYDMPRADWPATSVTSGQTMNFVYGAWVPHPGSIKYYITRDGFDVTQPLKWADLVPLADLEPEPPLVNGAYTASVTLPQRTGRHIIYSVWWRSDSTETFYGCSDVDFSGGGTSSPPPTSSCSAAVTVDSSWSGGFQGSATIKNTGTAPMVTWSVSFTVPSGVSVSQGWNGTLNQTGQQVTIHSAQWNGNLAGGASATAGFIGSASTTPAFSAIACGT